MPDPTPVTTPAADTVDSHKSTLQFCSTGVGTVDKFLPGLDVIPQSIQASNGKMTPILPQLNRSYRQKKTARRPRL